MRRVGIIFAKRSDAIAAIAFPCANAQTNVTMKPSLVIPVGVILLSFTCVSRGDILSDTAKLETDGKFAEAATALTNAMSDKSLSAQARKQLEFEAERLVRIRKDYQLTKETLFAGLKDSLKDVTREEFEKWIREGRFDSREIDGETRFMRSSVSNLYFRYPELEARRINPRDTAKKEADRLAAVRAITEASRAQKKNYVLPKRFHMTMTVTAKPDAAPDGETIRAWLPIPRDYPFQKDFRLISTEPRMKNANRGNSPIRSVYFEQKARAAKPTNFRMEYEYTTYGVHFEIDPDAVKPVNRNDPELAPFLKEAPHVQFTPEIRKLSHEIVGDETNDFRKAKKCYDWIAGQIKYSYATEYSTIRNISDYCRTRRYGDCGQEALLLITLCRFNGIPARWQSGWEAVPGGKNIHDWTEIYLAPYGWMPVDPYMGIWSMRYTRHITPEQQRELRDFYFGGLDQWRMIANSDHSQKLSPPKKSMRSDDVDFQRGELEWGDHNIYFDKYNYDLDFKEIELRD